MTDIAIIGGGAAGLMAGIAAARLGASVRVLDGAKRVGAKILVSGGSRCNVTNEFVAPSRFNGEGSAPFVSRILRSFSPADTHRFFREIGVELKLEETGKFFPTTDNSRTVLAALLKALEQAGALLTVQTPVTSLERDGEIWRLKIGGEMPEIIEARAVILATGGLALPKSGSDGRGFKLAQQFGHSLVATTPALTPLLARVRDHADLSGLTICARLTLYRGAKPLANEKLAEYDGSFLFTHLGYSGPVALNISRHVARSRWDYPDSRVYASFFPDIEADDEGRFWTQWAQQNARKNVANALSGHLPDSLAETMAARAGVAELPLGRLDKAQVAALRAQMFACPLPIHAVGAYEKAETTAGGIALAEIAPATMMSRLQDGLFFAGEICDVDGWLGGYNFQWAWSSGVVAGRAAGKWAAKLCG